MRSTWIRRAALAALAITPVLGACGIGGNPPFCGGSLETACVRDLGDHATGRVSGDQEIWYRFPLIADGDLYYQSCSSDLPSSSEDDVVVAYWIGDDPGSTFSEGEQFCDIDDHFEEFSGLDYLWIQVTSGDGASFDFDYLLEQGI